MAAAAPPPGLLDSMSKCGRCKSKTLRPTILSCLHSNCSECVKILLKNCAIICYQCKRKVTIRGESVFFEALSQVFAPGENIPKCQACKTRGIQRNSTQVCLDCPPPSHYCDECTDQHKTFCPMRNHRQVTLFEFMESGSVHPHDFPVTMCACCSKSKGVVSCRGCVLPLCVKCGVARSCSKGGKHDMEDESAAVERYRIDILQEMKKFKKNADSTSEQIRETEDRLVKFKRKDKKLINKLKKHHRLMLEEMRDQEELLQELCDNNSVEMATALSQMTEVQEANICGVKAGQRALDFTPEHLVGAALAEIKMLPRPSPLLLPSTQALVRNTVTFERPNPGQVANHRRGMLGTITCNKICKSWPEILQPSSVHPVTLPSGKGVILESAGKEGLYRVSPGNYLNRQSGNMNRCHGQDEQNVFSSATSTLPQPKLLDTAAIPITEISGSGVLQLNAEDLLIDGEECKQENLKALSPLQESIVRYRAEVDKGRKQTSIGKQCCTGNQKHDQDKHSDQEPPVQTIYVHRQDGKLNDTELTHKADVKMSVASTEESDKELSKIMFIEFQALLHQLTLENFQSHMKRIRLLQINTESRLWGIVDLIFEKALGDSSSSAICALLCFSLNSMSMRVPTDVQETPGKSATVTFRRILLLQCQKHFQDGPLDVKMMSEKTAAMERATHDDKGALQDELQLGIFKAKRRFRANVQFLGELFNIAMFSESIMQTNIIPFLKKYDDEDNLECLCLLLTTIGRRVDKLGAKVWYEQCFQKLEWIANEKLVCYRICSMIRNLLVLRKNKWVSQDGSRVPKPVVQDEDRVPKRVPKTTEQIHEGATPEDLKNDRSYAYHFPVLQASSTPQTPTTAPSAAVKASRQVVYKGSAAPSTSTVAAGMKSKKLKGVLPNLTLCIKGISLDTTEVDLKGYMKERGLAPKYVAIFASKLKEPLFAMAKVVVNHSAGDKVFLPSFWPERYSVKEWVNKKSP